MDDTHKGPRIWKFIKKALRTLFDQQENPLVWLTKHPLLNLFDIKIPDKFAHEISESDYNEALKTLQLATMDSKMIERVANIAPSIRALFGLVKQIPDIKSKYYFPTVLEKLLLSEGILSWLAILNEQEDLRLKSQIKDYILKHFVSQCKKLGSRIQYKSIEG